MRVFKFPKWQKWFYPDAIWDFFYTPEKKIYLTFDDGPNQETTPWLLDLLKQENIKATFFCLGSQAFEHPDLLTAISNEGHKIGTHGMFHQDGFFTLNSAYISNVIKSEHYFRTRFYRPPYGRTKPAQFKQLKKMGYTIVFWSCLTYDFDAKFSSENRINLIKKNTKPGAIFVFHDNKKAVKNLQTELPGLIQYWKNLGYSFDVIQKK
jgi:peptidoglycan/xylan/chitin deacetylase (PgdA/CDA1 family)